MFGFLKRKKKEQPKVSKVAFAYINSGGETVVWSDDSYEKFAKETFMTNVIAFQCINIIARAVSSVPWKLVKIDNKGKEVEIDDWRMKKVFYRPNKLESFDAYIYKLLCYYLIKGDSYTWRGMTSGNTIPKELIALRPDCFSIIPDSKGYPAKYVYQYGTIKEEYDVDPITGDSDILHIKSFHPLDNLYGMPQAKPASRPVDISNEASKWNMRLMMNEARPGMIVMFKGFLGEDAFNRIEKQLIEKQSGADNAGKNLILESEDGIVDVKPYSWSPKDIDFIEGGRETARSIAMGYGVPSMLLGIPGDNTYSNYKEARAALWEDTCFYYLNLLLNEHSCWLFGVGDDIKYGESANNQLKLVPDLDNIPALAYKQDLLWERSKTATDILTVNERRKMIGYDEIEGGDVLFVPASLIPLESAAEPLPPIEDIDDDDEDDYTDEPLPEEENEEEEND